MLETMSEEGLKEVQNYIRYITFRDSGYTALELLSEDAIVEQLTKSMERSDMGATTPADVVSRQMRDKYAF